MVAMRWVPAPLRHTAFAHAGDALVVSPVLGRRLPQSVSNLPGAVDSRRLESARGTAARLRATQTRNPTQTRCAAEGSATPSTRDARLSSDHSDARRSGS